MGRMGCIPILPINLTFIMVMVTESLGVNGSLLFQTEVGGGLVTDCLSFPTQLLGSTFNETCHLYLHCARSINERIINKTVVKVKTFWFHRPLVVKYRWLKIEGQTTEHLSMCVSSHSDGSRISQTWEQTYYLAKFLPKTV